MGRCGLHIGDVWERRFCVSIISKLTRAYCTYYHHRLTVSLPFMHSSPSIDTVLDDGDPSITYSDGWSETPNSLITSYYNNTYQYVFITLRTI